jgi:AcrR family transcriptional regulator
MATILEGDGRLKRSAATRAALVKAARGLFAQRGYDEVSTGEIVGEAGLTRNALYYHFPNKEALFRAVYEDVEQGVAARILPLAAEQTSYGERLRVGFQLFLDTCLERDVAEISVRQAPAVLGFPQMREIDNANYLGAVTATIEAGVRSGELCSLPARTTASMLVGALDEAALIIADAKRPGRAREEAGEVIDSLLVGLLTGRGQRRAIRA